MSQKSRTQSVMGQNQITEGVIWKQLLLFFFPILFGTFFQQLYNTADAVIVGRFVGKEALAAVGGPTGTLINLLVGFFVGLSSGATVTLVPLSEAVTTMYPLMQPAMDTLSEQIVKNQSTKNISYSDETRYTSTVLLKAVDTALTKAEIAK